MMIRFQVLLIVLAMLFSSTALAQKPDVKGSKDHPLISRFDGFRIDKYQETQFDLYDLPIGPAKDSKTYGDTLTLEGKITKISYRYEGESIPSLLQLFRSYENVFKDDKVEVLFSCFKLDCGAGAKDLVRTAAVSKRLLNNFMTFGEHAYHAVKIRSKDTDVYVGVFLKVERANVAYELAFVEVQSMNEGNIALGDIEKGIAETGKQAFYGLYFDTGKSTLKASSKDELSLLAEYLSNHASSQFFIVGHTDNVGSYQANIALSEQRATSVISALRDDYNLDVTNLTAIGIGPVSPVTSNVSDDGKAQNRRVELVLK